ncbi:hypothetical protein AB0J72_25490 [Dactylosporangium sp. NPDC049742]|uniref:hypothetical protein n=1 Tax=Dactylosporangium sp. NPDC049742 TaxID=3154737 RepID=UPI0034361FB3
MNRRHGTALAVTVVAAAAVWLWPDGDPAGGPTFYTAPGYGGTAATRGPGSHDLPRLPAAGIGNDAVSSIRVPAGYTVTAYAEAGFTGATWTFTADTPDLARTGSNDTISSLRIARKGTP